MPKVFIGIDPGVSGAITALNENGKVVALTKMPQTMGELLSFLQQYTDNDTTCYLEKVHLFGDGQHLLHVIHQTVVSLPLLFVLKRGLWINIDVVELDILHGVSAQKHLAHPHHWHESGGVHVDRSILGSHRMRRPFLVFHLRFRLLHRNSEHQQPKDVPLHHAAKLQIFSHIRPQKPLNIMRNCAGKACKSWGKSMQIGG